MYQSCHIYVYDENNIFTYISLHKKRANTDCILLYYYNYTKAILITYPKIYFDQGPNIILIIAKFFDDIF